MQDVIVVVEYSFLCKLTKGFSKRACNNTNLNKENPRPGKAGAGAAIRCLSKLP